uniref:Uncharacterized protein n=1 Tax=Spongospora subterranea TaxID=70186 RepID=A0A0H5QKX0_9EUKA|eukprot:CRZ02267.1 hypothetical protein [Spongospora subterranea]
MMANGAGVCRIHGPETRQRLSPSTPSASTLSSSPVTSPDFTNSERVGLSVSSRALSTPSAPLYPTRNARLFRHGLYRSGSCRSLFEEISAPLEISLDRKTSSVSGKGIRLR